MAWTEFAANSSASSSRLSDMKYHTHSAQPIGLCGSKSRELPHPTCASLIVHTPDLSSAAFPHTFFWSDIGRHAVKSDRLSDISVVRVLISIGFVVCQDAHEEGRLISAAQMGPVFTASRIIQHM